MHVRFFVFIVFFFPPSTIHEVKITQENVCAIKRRGKGGSSEVAAWLIEC